MIKTIGMIKIFKNFIICLAVVVILQPATSWAAARNVLEEEPTSPLLTTPAPPFVVLKASKERSQRLLLATINQLHVLENKIQRSEHLPLEAREAILNNIAVDIKFVQDQQAALEQAETVEEVRTVTREVLDYLREKRQNAQEQRQQFHARLQERVQQTQEIGNKIVERLRAVVIKLQAKGVDTVEIEGLIDAHATHIAELAQVSLDTPGDLKTAVENLRIEFATITIVMRSAVQGLEADQGGE